MSDERPILFSGPMVRAILSGQKTQTRRVIPEPKVARLHGRHSVPERHFADPGLGDGGYLHWAYGGGDLGDDVQSVRLRFRASVGDLLWVREAWRTSAAFDALSPTEIAKLPRDDGYPRAWAPIQFEADGSRVCFEGEFGGHDCGRLRPGMHMPRWASRLTLEVTSVRVERVQDISEDDARAEGVERITGGGMSLYPSKQSARATSTYREAFCSLWDSINGKRSGCSWEANPWVWVVAFRRLESFDG